MTTMQTPDFSGERVEGGRVEDVAQRPAESAKFQMYNVLSYKLVGGLHSAV